MVQQAVPRCPTPPNRRHDQDERAPSSLGTKAGGSLMLARIGYNLLQVFVVLAFAPLVEGVASRLKEILQSKRGPSIFQPLSLS